MRDKFLTEARGECWCEIGTFPEDDGYCCQKCGVRATPHPDYSTWEGFGKLWEWAQHQEWWRDFMEDIDNPFNLRASLHLIHPDRFADALYTFLRERESC